MCQRGRKLHSWCFETFNRSVAHSVSLCVFRSLPCTLSTVFLCLHPSLSSLTLISRPCSFLSRMLFPCLQTVPAVELRSSRDSLSWRWRNSGTSAASDAGPATWFSLENTSASECVKGGKKTKRNTTFQRMSHSEKTHKLKKCPAVFVL